jgi:superfamily I DNA/RNA helicase
MPVLRDVNMWQNDWVLVDEAQDTNPVRLALAKKMLRPGGRLVAVGDPCQAIYGFAGADSESLNKIAKEFNAIQLPLTVTYRCPKSIVAHARQWVNHIEAHESAPEGSVTSMLREDFDKLDGNALRKSDAVLCRNTAPLVALAFSLIRRRIACHVEGRDIGQGLIALAKRWKVKTVGALRGRLDGYRERETERFMAKGQEAKAAQLQDKVDTLIVIMDTLTPSDTVDAVVKIINDLFGDTEDGKPSPSLTLCTVHKAKGREWHRVYLYGRNKFMPSRYARQDWQVEQETNLIYVAVTRAKEELIEVEV